jgi:hypothetical protein
VIGIDDEARILGFLSEISPMRKTAQYPARLVGKLVAGGLGGGAYGYATGGDLPREARIRRAVEGGLLGALAGGGAHALAPGGARELADVARREMYGLIGRVPRHTPEELLRLRLGTAGKALAVQEAARAGMPTARLQAQLDAARAGVDTLPGVLRGLVTRPGETAGISWRAMPATRKALLGLGGLQAARTAVGGSGPGEDYGQETGREVGRAAALLASGSLPVVPAVVLSSGGSGLGSLLGQRLI